MIRKKKAEKKSTAKSETIKSTAEENHEELALEAVAADEDDNKIVLDMSEDEVSEETALPVVSKKLRSKASGKPAKAPKELLAEVSAVPHGDDSAAGLAVFEDLDDEEADSRELDVLGFGNGESDDEDLATDSGDASDGSSGALLEELMSLQTKVEAILFAAPKPIKPSEIEELIGDERISTRDIIQCIDQLLEFYETRGGGFKLEYLKNLGYQFRTIPAASPIMERMFSSRPRPLSRAAMETLAIVAYRQPVTRAEIEFIRGVDAGSILKNLLERELVKCVGRKADAGRPMLFGTSDEFLRVFRLSGLDELPSLDSFQTDPSLIQAAMEKLDSEQAVSIEGFIAGEGASADLDEDATEEDLADEFAQPMTRSIQGASRADNGELDSTDQDSVNEDNVSEDSVALNEVAADDDDLETMSATKAPVLQADADDIEDPQ